MSQLGGALLEGSSGPAVTLLKWGSRTSGHCPHGICALAAGAGARDRSVDLSLGESLEVVPLLCYSASVLLGQRNGVSHFWGQFLFPVLIFLASGFPMMEVCVMSSVSQAGRDLEGIQVSHSHWYFVIITVIFTYKIKGLATGYRNAFHLWKYLSSEGN